MIALPLTQYVCLADVHNVSSTLSLGSLPKSRQSAIHAMCDVKSSASVCVTFNWMCPLCAASSIFIWRKDYGISGLADGKIERLQR